MAWWIESRWSDIFQPVSTTGNLEFKEYDNTLLKDIEML